MSPRADEEFDVDATVALMHNTHIYEEAADVGATYWDCFKGVDLRRTEVTCVVWAIQNLSGSGFVNVSRLSGTQANIS